MHQRVDDCDSSLLVMALVEVPPLLLWEHDFPLLVFAPGALSLPTAEALGTHTKQFPGPPRHRIYSTGRALYARILPGTEDQSQPASGDVVVGSADAVLSGRYSNGLW